jgi:transposase
MHRKISTMLSNPGVLHTISCAKYAAAFFTYTPEFKESAIKLALDSDESIPQIAKNLGINSNTLYTWVHNASKPKGNTNVVNSGV